MKDFIAALDKGVAAFMGTLKEQRLPDTVVTVGELIARKTSQIRYEGRLYKVQVTEVELTK